MSDRNAAVKLLRKDLANGPNHCFGNHANCSPDFCTSAKDRSEDPPPTGNPTPSRESDVAEDNDDVVGKSISCMENMESLILAFLTGAVYNIQS